MLFSKLSHPFNFNLLLMLLYCNTSIFELKAPVECIFSSPASKINLNTMLHYIAMSTGKKMDYLQRM